MRIRVRILTVHKTRKIETIDVIVMIVLVMKGNKMDQSESSIIVKIDQEGKVVADKGVTEINRGLIVVANGNLIGE